MSHEDVGGVTGPPICLVCAGQSHSQAVPPCPTQAGRTQTRQDPRVKKGLSADPQPLATNLLLKPSCTPFPSAEPGHPLAHAHSHPRSLSSPKPTCPPMSSTVPFHSDRSPPRAGLSGKRAWRRRSFSWILVEEEDPDWPWAWGKTAALHTGAVQAKREAWDACFHFRDRE